MNNESSVIYLPIRRTKKPENWLQKLFKVTLIFFNATNEPVIQEHRTISKAFWTIYDPQTNQRHIFHSEQEIRVWLENRYYQ